ncbi:MAG: tetratricopeptide repeat protein, partial [Synechococcus sp.]
MSGMSWPTLLMAALPFAVGSAIQAAPQPNAPSGSSAPASDLPASGSATSKAVREAQEADEVVRRILTNKQANFTYPRLIDAQSRALQAWLKTGMTKEMNLRRIDLASTYLTSGDLRLGKQVAEEVLQAYRHPQAQDENVLRSSALGLAAMIASEKGEFESAIAYHRENIKIMAVLNESDPGLRIAVYSALAQLYSALGNISESRGLIEESKQVLMSSKGSESTASGWAHVLLIELGILLSHGEINHAMLTLAEMGQRLGPSLS